MRNSAQQVANNYPRDTVRAILLTCMGIYNLIHDVDDDLYYYCPVSDCPCHGPDYYDSSRNHSNNEFTGYLN